MERDEQTAETERELNTAPSGHVASYYDSPFARGDTIGRYVVLDKIGQGGMADVYGAYDPDLNRRVALKVLRSEVDGDPEGKNIKQARLLREAQAMAQISHPNVLPVHDVGTVLGRVFIATEYVEGQTLDEWVRERHRSWREVVQAFVTAGRGLAAAHHAGLIHRDFKPQNVLVAEDGTIRVMDFGLVRLSREADDPKNDAPTSGHENIHDHALRGGSKVTKTGSLVGTLAYMAPEQHAGKTVGPAADQYSFCLALWEALHGAHPFVGAKGLTLVEAKRVMRLKPASDVSVPRWIKRSLLRGLNPDPAVRWPSMDDLLQALQRDPARRIRRVIGAVAVLGGVVSSGLFAAYAADQNPEPCRGAHERLQPVWNPHIRARLQESFLSTDLPHAADTATELFTMMDDYADEWAKIRTTACRATLVHREQSGIVMERTMACLDDSLDQVSGYLQALAELADEKAVNRAIPEFPRMAGLELCKDANALARRDKIPVPEDEREVVEQLRHETRRLNALVAASAVPQIEAQIERMDEVLVKVSHVPTRTATLWAKLVAYHQLGRAEDRNQLLPEVINLAAQYDDKSLLARAWSTRLWIAVHEERRLDKARDFIPVAEAAVTQARDEPDVDTIRNYLDLAITNVELLSGNLPAADQRYTDLVARGGNPRNNYNNLAVLLTDRGRSDTWRESGETSRDSCEPEICNGLDDDCDGLIDEVATDNSGCGTCRLEQFMDRAYWFCDTNVTWEVARDACRALGSELAVLEDVAHNDFVAAKKPSNGGSFYDDFWIGLHDRNTEGAFEWIDGTPLVYTNWAPNEPNNDRDEDCGEFYHLSPGAWNDNDCVLTRGYVCSAVHVE